MTKRRAPKPKSEVKPKRKRTPKAEPGVDVERLNRMAVKIVAGWSAREACAAGIITNQAEADAWVELQKDIEEAIAKGYEIELPGEF